MGLGKTVELLACLMAHPYSGPAFKDSKVDLQCVLLASLSAILSRLSFMAGKKLGVCEPYIAKCLIESHL